MGSFVDGVRQERVVGPLRRGFKPATWDKEFANLGNDEADKSLHMVGRLLHAKATTIRESLKMTLQKEINSTTKLRAFVALANRDTLTLKRKTQAAQDELAQSKEVVAMSELAALRIPLSGGQSYSPDEIVQSLVDGLQISIRAVLDLRQPIAGNPKSEGLVWDDVAFDFNLGCFYEQVEELWDDCLWNDYVCNEVKQGKFFSPNDPFWKILHAASRARQANLAIEFFTRSDVALEQLLAQGRIPLFNTREVKSVDRDHRRQVVRLAPASKPTEEGRRLIAARAYASEPYYTELINEPQEILGGASLSELMQAWTVVVQCSKLLAEKLLLNRAGDGPPSSSWLSTLAPVLQRDALRRAVHESVGVDYRQSGNLVDFLTYRGQPNQELWAQPLVLVGDDTFSPIFAAAHYADLQRLIDVWLRQLGVDMGVRGPAFEKHVRTEIKEQIENSPLLGTSIVLDDGFVLRPSGERDEEIDILIVVDDLVFIGEAKCSVPPTDAKAYALHRKLVMGAVAQVNRKATAVDKHRELFCAQLADKGIAITDKFKVLPVVIMNAAFHTGMAVNDVPVVDLHVFSIFFSGELVEAAMGRNMTPVSTRSLYTSASDAADRADAIFRSPPQMELFVKGVREASVRVPAITDRDWEGRYLTFDCIVDASHLMPGGTSASQGASANSDMPRHVRGD
jgi:hypothetical protein